MHVNVTEEGAAMPRPFGAGLAALRPFVGEGTQAVIREIGSVGRSCCQGRSIDARVLAPASSSGFTTVDLEANTSNVTTRPSSRFVRLIRPLKLLICGNPRSERA